MHDEGLREPVKRFDQTFSGEQVALEALLAERPDVAWFVAPERVYSINDNPNTLREWSARLFIAIISTIVTVTLATMIITGGH